MVKVNTGPQGAAQASGELAGGVYSRNRYGMYIRALATPVNPQSPDQVAVRSALSSLTARWSQVLTQAQRDAWDLYASNVPVLDVFGNQMNLTGFNHYIRSNQSRVRVGGTAIDAGPTIFELPTQDPLFAITASEGTQLISATFDDTLDWCDESEGLLWLFGGQPQNPQRKFFNGPWRYAGNVAGDAVTPPTSPQTVTSPFVITEGQRLWVYARIQRADGRLSSTFRSDVAVGA